MVIIVRFKSFFLFIFSFKLVCVYTNILNLSFTDELNTLHFVSLITNPQYYHSLLKPHSFFIKSLIKVLKFDKAFLFINTINKTLISEGFDYYLIFVSSFYKTMLCCIRSSYGQYSELIYPAGILLHRLLYWSSGQKVLRPFVLPYSQLFHFVLLSLVVKAPYVRSSPK